MLVCIISVAKMYQMLSAGVHCSDIEHMEQFLLGQVRYTKSRTQKV
jgi:hypothetical protein